MRLVSVLASIVLVAAACGPTRPSGGIPFGFTRASAERQLALEERFRAQPDADRIRDTHREITRRPHPAGSARDRELAEWTAQQFTSAGMQDVRIVTHEVMLPRPLEVTVEMTGPQPWRAPMREDPVADPDTHIDVTAEAMPFHAYSASGDVTARVVNAGDGEPSDYRALRARGVDVRGAIVLVRSADSSRYVYRGYKAFVAQENGAAGILLFPAGTQAGAGESKTYPDGRRAPDSTIERGSISYDFVAPGDPLTPGWPSIKGARRIERKDARSLPQIVSAPISARDAQRILDTLREAAASAPLSPRKEDDRAPAVRLRVRIDDSVRPIWTVTGTFHGAERLDEIVILGNHRDAWVYGGVDPSSGSAALVELARAFGALVREGWRPRRTILFASWDAEEFALTSSTEWVEEHEEWLRDRAVAYVNVDSAVSGSRLVVGATPSLGRLVREVADAVRDPQAGTPLGTLLRDRLRTERNLTRPAEDHELVDERLGGGSDYVPFVNFLGVPAADLAFEGTFPVYHSLYDTHQWVARFGDPGFRYHAALVRLWGLTALRLAQADVLPIDPHATATRIADYVQTAAVGVSADHGEHVRKLTAAVADLVGAAAAFARRRDAAVATEDADSLNALSRQVLRFERAFLDVEGLEGRPWYRHLVYAPNERYEPVMLPGLDEAIRQRDGARISREARRLLAAVGRAGAQLGQGK